MGIEVQRQRHNVHISATFAIAKQTAFHTVGTGHDGQFGGGHAGAPVVVRVHGQHDMLAGNEVAVHPFNLIGKHIGGGVLHGRWQVDDDGALRPNTPGRDCRLAGLQRHVQLGQVEGLGRVLQRPLRFRVGVGQGLEIAHVV